MPDTYAQRVAEARSPHHAMRVLAEGMDAVLAKLAASPRSDWFTEEWDDRLAKPLVLPISEDQARSLRLTGYSDEYIERQTRIIGTRTEGDPSEVVIPAPSEERMDRRRMFEAQSLKLAAHLGEDEDWNEVYAKGGPMWLYTGNRELVLSFPEHVRQAMVDDVLQDSQQDAHEMGRDILKQACETGPGGTGMMVADEL